MNKYIDFVNYKKKIDDKYPEFINIYYTKEGCYVFDTSAEIISIIYNNSIHKNNFDKTNYCYFQVETIINIIKTLEDKHINYTIINLIDLNKSRKKDYKDKNQYSKYTYLLKEKKDIQEIKKQFKFNNKVDINTKVTIKNLNTLERETYIIRKDYYTMKPTSVSSNKFCSVKINYKEDQIKDHDIRNNEISLSTPVAQELIGHRKGEIILIKDKNIKDCEYLIEEVISI